MASLTRSVGSESNEWESTLVAAGCAGRLPREARRGRRAGGVIDFLVRDPRQPVERALLPRDGAPQRARGAHGADRRHVGGAQRHLARAALLRELRGRVGERILRLLEWVKHRSLLFNGAYANTMLRNDAFYFTQLGTFLERADNTARILDVKYHVLLPKSEAVGGPLDYCQWESILRAVSALRAYHWVYHARLTPWMIAELLILRPEMPRSLCACYAQITRHLELLAEAYGGQARRVPPARRRDPRAAPLRAHRRHHAVGAARVPDRDRRRRHRARPRHRRVLLGRWRADAEPGNQVSSSMRRSAAPRCAPRSAAYCSPSTQVLSSNQNWRARSSVPCISRALR